MKNRDGSYEQVGKVKGVEIVVREDNFRDWDTGGGNTLKGKETQHTQESAPQGTKYPERSFTPATKQTLKSSHTSSRLSVKNNPWPAPRAIYLYEGTNKSVTLLSSAPTPDP